MATHSSVLAWRIPGMGEPDGLPSMGLHRVRHDWSDLATTSLKDLVQKKMWLMFQRGTSLVVQWLALGLPMQVVWVWFPVKGAKIPCTSPSKKIRSDQIRSVAQLCPTLCDPINRSMPGLPVYHQLPEFTETHVHRVSDAIQPSHPLSSPSPPAPNPSQHQSFPMSQLFTIRATLLLLLSC